MSLTQYHCRMNFAVCPCLAIERSVLSRLQRLRGCGYHGCLLLHRVNVLNDARGHKILPLIVVKFAVLEHLNVMLLHQQAAVLDNEQWPGKKMIRNSHNARIFANLVCNEKACHRYITPVTVKRVSTCRSFLHPCIFGFLCLVYP